MTPQDLEDMLTREAPLRIYTRRVGCFIEASVACCTGQRRLMHFLSKRSSARTLPQTTAASTGSSGAILA